MIVHVDAYEGCVTFGSLISLDLFMMDNSVFMKTLTTGPCDWVNLGTGGVGNLKSETPVMLLKQVSPLKVEKGRVIGGVIIP